MAENLYMKSEFLDLLPEIVFEINSDLTITFLNKSCEKILGYSRDNLINNKIKLEDFVVPSDLNKIKDSIKNNFIGNHISGNCYKVYRSNGEEITLEFYNSHIEKDGVITGLRCIAIDITEKERKHTNLINQEKNFRQIFFNFPLPYQSLDKDGVIIDVNPSWTEVLGYSREEIIGKNFMVLLSKENRNNFTKAYQDFKNKGIASNVQFDIIKKNGKAIFVNYHGRVEKDIHGNFLRSHCVFSDITLQKRAEQTLINSEVRLRELNATKDKFFSIIAHDLKNPFNDLMGFTQLLALNIDKYDKLKIEQFAKIIHQSSKLAYNLLENLLDWSRAQTGTLKFKPEKILINNIVDENIDLLESTARNKNIHIYSEIENELYAYADKNMIRTVIRNLISNAIKYTNQGGFVNIKSHCGKKCEISISDNGIGISKENVSKIFKIDESFSTLGTEKEKGTGLGLILCKEFIEKNGGKLSVKSKLNEGSSFIFTLPLPEINY